jgi:hypothetical protein
MTMELHIVDPTKKLDAVARQLERGFARAKERIQKLMPQATGIYVTILADGYTLPETGVSGHSHTNATVEITLDPSNANFEKNFEMEFAATLAHQVHHCIRRRGPGFGATLGEALVSEGLACHFETELRDGNAPFYGLALDIDGFQQMWARAQGMLQDKSYDHAAWFYGAPGQGFPPYAGNTLGMEIADHYIRTHNRTASQLVELPAHHFYFGSFEAA